MSEFHLLLALLALLQGFTLLAGIIIAIGPQNVFVLRQGLKQQYAFPTASVCFLSDVTLISLGAIGFVTLKSKVPEVTEAIAYVGITFLLFYGFYSFKLALAPVRNIEIVEAESKDSLSKTILAVLALCLFNPNIYLEDLVILGDIASSYPASQRLFFSLGAMLASFVWYFGLAYGASWLTPLFQRPSAWRILDAIAGCIMWTIAGTLIFSVLNHSL